MRLEKSVVVVLRSGGRGIYSVKFFVEFGVRIGNFLRSVVRGMLMIFGKVV